MNLDTLKSGMDHLAGWFPDQPDSDTLFDQTQWVGWDGWVDVDQHGSGSMGKSMTTKASVNIRRGSVADLEAVNRVIEACVMSWNIPERVKRLSLSSYRYSTVDLDHLDLLVAVDGKRDIIGVAGLETAEIDDLPSAAGSGLLLHGLYVAPHSQKQGVGSQLLSKAFDSMKSRKLGGLLAKAQPDAIDFFRKQGLEALPASHSKKGYPHRLWRAA